MYAYTKVKASGNSPVMEVLSRAGRVEVWSPTPEIARKLCPGYGWLLRLDRETKEVFSYRTREKQYVLLGKLGEDGPVEAKAVQATDPAQRWVQCGEGNLLLIEPAENGFWRAVGRFLRE